MKEQYGSTTKNNVTNLENGETKGEKHSIYLVIDQF